MRTDRRTVEGGGSQIWNVKCDVIKCAVSQSPYDGPVCFTEWHRQIQPWRHACCVGKTISGPKRIADGRYSNRRSNPVDRRTASTDKDRSCRSIPGRGTVTRGIDRRPPADNSVTTGRLLFSICSSAQTSTDPCCPYAAKLLPRPPCGYSFRAVWKSPFLRIIRLWASVVDRPNTGPFSDVIDQTATHLKSVPTSALRVNSWHMPAARHLCEE